MRQTVFYHLTDAVQSVITPTSNNTRFVKLLNIYLAEMYIFSGRNVYIPWPKRPWYELDELAMIRLQYLPMTHDQLDIAILDKLSCGMHLSSMTRRTRKGEQQERKVQRTDFYLHGFRICRDIIRQLHAISQDKLTGITRWLAAKPAFMGTNAGCQRMH